MKKIIKTLLIFALMIALFFAIPLKTSASPPKSSTASPTDKLSGGTITVPNPGNHQNIQPNFQAAVDSASPGDTLLLPRGEFYLDGRVVIDKFLNISGSGYEVGGTKLYRREDISDAELSAWRMMLEFQCYSDEPSKIIISGIHFKGKNPSLVPGDGGSTVDDYGLQMKQCVDFIITKNKFEHFGFAAVYVRHRDALARGVVTENLFHQNLNIEPGGDHFNVGYGVVLFGDDNQWIPDPQFGTDNFIFIEDNTFIHHRHAVASGGTGRYVFRKNKVIDNLIGSAVDAHGGGKYGNTLSTRAFEVYENEIYNTKFADGTPIIQEPPNGTCRDLAYVAIFFRGGEGIVFGNTLQGFKNGVGFTTEITGSYPVITQIGFLSGQQFGPNHKGIEPPESNGDIFVWGNTFVPFHDSSCQIKYRNFRQELLEEGRDYHLDTPKPGYSPFTYPHPLRQLISKPSPTFSDVPFDHWAHDYIESLYQAGYVAGCSTDPLLYCPEDILTRGESAVFVERGVHGADYLPPQPSEQIFSDVPLGEWYAKWADGLWQDGYTAGCGTDPLIFCPLQEHTRTEGAVFFLRMLNGSAFIPPDPAGIFSDVPTDFWGAKWAEAAYDAGIIPACETEPELRFCPHDPLDRAMAAYMMVQAKGLETP